MSIKCLRRFFMAVIALLLITLQTNTGFCDEIECFSNEFSNNGTKMVEQKWVCHPRNPLAGNPGEIVTTQSFAAHVQAGDSNPGYDIKIYSDNEIEVYASISGNVVVSANDSNGYGYYVVIETFIGPVQYRITYAHLTAPSYLTVGDSISQGDYIGIMGNTGRSTGPHLHFEVDRDGEETDPEIFLGGVTETLVTPVF